MSDFSITRVLNAWHFAEIDQAREEDSRRTEECLKFADIVAFSSSQEALPAEVKRHVHRCAWCQRAIAIARSIVDRAEGEPTAYQTSSLAEGEMADVLRQHIAQKANKPKARLEGDES